MIVCSYGCGKEAKFYLKKSKKWCCSKSANSCDVNRLKNKLANIGRKHSYETKKKISIGNKGKDKIPWIAGKCHSEKTKIKMRNSIFTDEHRKKISESLKNKPGRKHTDETKQKIRDKNIGRICLEETKQKISNKNKGKIRNQQFKDRQRKYMLNGLAKYANSFPKKITEESRQKSRDRMLNGQAVYMNKCIKNPSKPELMLRERVKKIYPNAEFQYQIFNYSLDIALPEYKIAIEYDGYYHFNNKENILYHRNRQEKIENCGWKFLRYTIFDKFPNQMEVQDDLIKVIEGWK